MVVIDFIVASSANSVSSLGFFLLDTLRILTTDTRFVFNFLCDQIGVVKDFCLCMVLEILTRGGRILRWRFKQGVS